ncbi:MAG TPA: ATP-binding cassette domain-containing protein [Acidimicrobiales bacterium]|nr:ATP-binding cassette domain-containing protein [Acidimicrobiales bacterium]
MRRAGWVVLLVPVWLVAAALLPNGVPVGVVLRGLVLGALTGFTAMGLVLVYRTSRVINFAQAEIGGLAAVVAVVMVTGWHLPYFAALPVGLLVAVGTGWVVDAVVVRRFFTAPRLILTVATVGLLQVLGAGELALPRAFAHLKPLSTFSTPFRIHLTVDPFVFNGDDLVAVVVAGLVLLGLVLFFRTSDTGIAVRAAADSNERALLLGIPVRRLSRVTWMLAAGLSGVGAMLTAPIVGPDLGGVSGPEALLPPLAAAVIGRFESLPATVAASLGIEVFRQVVFWSYPRSSTVDLALFVIIVAAQLLQRRRTGRGDDSGLGGYVAAREVRPVPEVLSRLREVRVMRGTGWLALAAVVLLVPIGLSDSKVTLTAYIAIFGIFAVSLVILTGWSGQISLGQFGFAGVGAGATAGLMAGAGADMFLSILVAALVGAVLAVLIGIPAVRIPGQQLAVTTLAFGVPLNTFFLNAAYFPALAPTEVRRPALLGRIDLSGFLTFYYFCLAALALAVVVAWNYRRTRAGRVVVAVRDNERAAAAYGVEPARAKLTAFALSGAMAAVAGALYMIGLGGVPFSGFAPLGSLTVFTMVVIGGVASLPGALLGAVYVESVQYFLHGGLQLLATGGGLLLLLMLVPGGLGELVYSGRDRLLRALARRRGLSVPSLAEQPDIDVATPGTPAAGSGVPTGVPTDVVDGALVSCEGIDAGYGQVQVLFDVGLAVAPGEIVALLGTNGAGKSTVLRVIAGLLTPAAGRVRFEGRDITDLDPIARVQAGLVTVPGGRGVFGSLTVAENLRMAGWLARDDRAFLEGARTRIFELFPVLEERLDTTAAALSGGEQQMLTLAQALLCRPRLLVIDELSLGLAPAVVSLLLDVVRRINAGGTTVVVVEQSVNVAAALAGRAVFMEKGQVRFTGPVADLMGRPDLLRSVFLPSAPTSRRRSRARPGGTASAGPSGDAGTGSIAPLRVQEISRRFGGITAVDGVSFHVGDREVLGIIGSNGAGKTTLFDLVSGFLPPDQGRVVLAGADVTREGAAGRAERGLGRSFQDARLFPSMTVAEALATALERHIEVRDPVACLMHVQAVAESERAAARRVDELIETMGLGRYRHAFVSELSTGTRRIVELACALAHSPRVLLLDEPSSGIAQRESEALGQLLIDLRERTGASLVVIEHDIPLVSSISDRLLCLHLGRVLAEGAPADVLKDPAVVASYLGSDEVTVARSGRRPGRSRTGGGRSGAAVSETSE